MADIEALLTGLLHNAAARESAASAAAPEHPSPEYRTGFAAGYEAGELAALALVLSFLNGGSATQLVDEARAQAAVDGSFPFTLHVQATEEAA
jgi:hypothetical protein